MNIQNVTFGGAILTLVLALVAIVYTLGVVWRVEKKLDLAFKFFLASIFLFFIAQIIKNIPMLVCCLDNTYFDLSEKAANFLFVVFFLVGILEMRKMIRKMDGEE